MKLYIIPAYLETIKNQGYKAIINDAKNKKYQIEILNLQLKNKSLDALVKEGIKKIGNNTDSVIFGFSTGALIAYCISKKLSIKKGIFCSISPILNKDIPKNKRLYIKYFGEETVNELKRTSYGKSISLEPLFLCGDKEGRKLIGRTKKLCVVSKGKIIIVKKNNHEMNKDYVNEVKKLL